MSTSPDVSNKMAMMYITDSAHAATYTMRSNYEGGHVSIKDETYTLNTGATIPKIAFGTWQIPNGDEANDSVAFALKTGYRHIDTARAYGNEESVGKAVRDSGISREDIFITTKLPAEVKTYDGALETFETTMAALDMEYVDLYLIHAPWPWNDIGSDHTEGNIQAWKALETIYKSGRAKAIGVSNFTPKDIQALLDATETVPAANQIRFFVGHTSEETMAFCEKNNIIVEAYSPLATGELLENKDLVAIAEKYQKSVAQICIRYTLQRGTVSLPKSTHEERIRENIDVDFVISDEDMKTLNELEDSSPSVY